MNSNKLLKNRIVRFITDSQGCKLLELITTISAEIFSNNYVEWYDEYTSSTYFDLLIFSESIKDSVILSNLILNSIDELSESQDIIVIKYSLEKINYREKLFLLPKNTKISLSQSYQSAL